MDLILHHYWGSNYAEKVRLLLGLKSLTWHSVLIPDVMPKPDLIPLTGGYSKTPVLQIGADVYCDTKRIADELEARFPKPSFYPGGSEGLSQMVQYWADGALTLAGGRYLIGRSHERWRPEFHADRAALWGVPVDLERMARSAERYRQQLTVYLEWIELSLSDGRRFLLGDAPGLADVSCSHILWFLESGGEKATDVLPPFEKVQAWLARTRQIGHGTVVESNAQKALDAARDAKPQGRSYVEAGNREGLVAGDVVSVRAEIAGRDPVVGALHTLTRLHVAVSVKNDRVGDVVVHFPRVGYVVSRA
jgi:glutathione S-transferase